MTNLVRKQHMNSSRFRLTNVVVILSLVYLLHLSSQLLVSAESSSDLKMSANNVHKDIANANLLNAESKLKVKDHDDDDDDDDDDHDHHDKKKKGDKTHSKESSEESTEKHHDKANKFGFIHAFFASISVIVVSEIGDKTFFIAAIMAMKHPRAIVYAGAMFALGLMTLLSALLGNIVTKVIPRAYTYYLSSLLFAIFGIKMLREGLQMSKDETNDEEYQEAQESLKQSEEADNPNSAKNLEAGGESAAAAHDNADSWMTVARKFVVALRKYISPIFLQAFILTFLAEWGDRSQISTIILGARENMIGTIIGGTIGHGLCTGMAVLGGRFVAQRISVRTVTLCGAFVFLFFALSAFYIDPDMD